MTSRTDGYSPLSVLIHWLAALLVVALFLTHEGDPGTATHVIHVSGGAVAGLFLLWRVWYRIGRGLTEAPQQAAVLNLAARLVHWGLLLAMVVVVITGYLLPWSAGQALDVFGIGIPSPMSASGNLHEFLERVHDLSSHLFIPLLFLHLLGAVKHAVFDRRGPGFRMFKPVAGGR